MSGGWMHNLGFVRESDRRVLQESRQRDAGYKAIETVIAMTLEPGKSLQSSHSLGHVLDE